MTASRASEESAPRVVPGSSGGRIKPPRPTLQKLSKEDDVESYLDMFERVAGQQGWPKETWATQLAGLLSGEALDAFTSVPMESARNYDIVKEAILARFLVNADTYRLRFRSSQRGTGESYKLLLSRQTDLLNRWSQSAGSELKEIVLLEQFLLSLPTELSVKLRERKPSTAKEAAGWADDYDVAHRLAGNPPGPSAVLQPRLKEEGEGSIKLPPKGNLQTGHRIPGKKGGGQGSPLRSKTNHKGELQCFSCEEWGHIAAVCPNKKSTGVKAKSKPALFNQSGEEGQSTTETSYVQSGSLDGKPVTILVDTGSRISVVRADLVEESKCTEGTAALECVHGDSISYPTARVALDINGWSKELSAAVVPKLPVDVLISWADYMSVGKPSGTTSLAVVTRSQRKKHMQGCKGKDNGVAGQWEGNGPATRVTRGPVSQYLPLHPESSPAQALDRQPDEQMDDQKESGEENCPPQVYTHTPIGDVLQASPQQLADWQHGDPTLSKTRELASGEGQAPGRAQFCYQNGLLYRKWSPDGSSNHVKACEQLVLPKQCRSAALQLAHDVPAAGHLGVNKTRTRILHRFYWPGVFKEVADHCRQCEVCQRSADRRDRIRAEMIPMPLIEKPFQRIAMDIVGPLPRSRAGNKYILTICDYATRYPEAIPLPSTEAERIAKELVKLFARVGIPDEILSDQGTNFMSTLLQEIYQMLHIKRIRTTPYHPQTDGLVERFNGTLKSMLRKLTSKNQKDWDELLPYILFAYREVPQESTGFAPFELLYGHRIRGPLDVLKEVWSGEEIDNTTVAAHVITMRERLQDMTDLVQANLMKAQKKQKRIYDERARPQTLNPGDKVLVLVPARCSKLQLEWAGPYKITRQVTPVDYEVETPGRRKEKKIYHVNLLKKWHFPPNHSALLVVLQDTDKPKQETEEVDLEDALLPPMGLPKIMTKGLTPSQQEDLKQLLNEFPDVAGEKLGRTAVIQHEIRVVDSEPIHQQPYRIPAARKEVIKKEIDKMLGMGIIQPSTSPWASPTVLVEKKDGDIRFCVDYRKLNRVSKFDAYPMPRVEDVLDNVGAAKYISTLDLAKGYWQIPMAGDSKEKTAFTTPFGLFEFQVMPFGLHNAPATFQRMMNDVLRECFDFCQVYIDDVAVYSTTWEEHVEHLRRVFTCLREANLTLKMAKCQFGRRQVEYLGYVVGNGKVLPNPKKIEAVLHYQQPVMKTDVKAFQEVCAPVC